MQHRRLLPIILISIWDISGAVLGPCTLCIDGSNNHSRPSDYLITIPGFPPVSCDTAASLAGSFASATSTECYQAQLLGSPLCGCSIQEEEPCMICPPLKTGPITTIHDISLPQEGRVPELSSLLFDDQVLEPSCEMVQAVLLNFARTSETCQTSLEEAQKNCVCSSNTAVLATNNVTSIPTRNETTDDTNTATAVQQPTTINENKCSLCRSGAAIQFPDREIAGFVTPTCGILDTVTATLDTDSSECSDAQNFGLYCGCPDIPDDDRCTLCVDGSEPLYPDTTIDYIHLPNTDKYAPTCAIYESLIAGLSGEYCMIARGAGVLTCGCPIIHETTCVMCPGGIPEDRYLDTIFDGTYTCRQYESFQYVEGPKDYNCRGLTYYADKCGCRDGVRTYGGAETRLDQIILSWAPRPSALLSLLGSFSILYSVFKSRKTMYHQIMIGLSVVDILSSAAWLVSNAAVPKDDAIYGSMGNMATCRVQGLLTIFTLSSLWFNLSLSIYYKLVIIDGWQESKFKKPLVRFCLLGIPALIGVCISLSSYTHIVEHPVSCTVIPWPWGQQWVAFMFILFLPSLIPVIAVPYVTMYVCARFAKQTKASQRWRLSAQTQRSSGTLGANEALDRRYVGWCSTLGQFKSRLMADSLDSKVLRQSLFYLVAFFACFPIGVAYTILGFFHIYPYWMSVLLMILVPLQGFNNAIVFFRHRILTMCRNRRKKRQTNKGPPSRAEPKHQTKRAPPPPPAEPKHQMPFESKIYENSKGKEDEAKKDFLRSHFIEDNLDEDQSDEDHFDSDIFDVNLADTEDAIESTTEDNTTETVLVGSFVIPTHRGSVVWKAVNWDEEVSDYMYKEEEEEEEEPTNTRRASTLPTPATSNFAARRLRHSMPPIVRGNTSTQ